MKTCAFRTYVKGGGGIRCSVRDGLVLDATCEACLGERKHVSDHPRAVGLKLPRTKDEQDWLDRLGIGAHKHDA